MFGARPQARKQVDLIVLERQRLEAACELDAPVLAPQHCDNRFDMIAGAGE